MLSFVASNNDDDVCGIIAGLSICYGVVKMPLRDMWDLWTWEWIEANVNGAHEWRGLTISHIGCMMKHTGVE